MAVNAIMRRRVNKLWILLIPFFFMVLLGMWMVWTGERIVWVGKGEEAPFCKSNISEEPVALASDDIFVFKTYDGSIGAIRFKPAYDGLADYSSIYFNKVTSNTGGVWRTEGRVFRRSISIMDERRIIRPLLGWSERKIQSGPLVFLWFKRTMFMCPEEVQYVSIVKTNNIEFVKGRENSILWQAVNHRRN